MHAPFESHHLVHFDSSPFRDPEGRLRVLVVFKKTRLQLYTQKSNDLHLQELIEHHDPSVENLQETHDKHVHCLAHVVGVLKRLKADVVTCYRGDLTAVQTAGRVVITVGGDGTMLDAAHYISDSPLLGVNSDPTESVGSLCIATPESFESVFQAVMVSQIPICPAARMAACMDGEDLEVSSLNDILIAHENPAAMSRYVIDDGSNREEHKSSGVWIGAATGSTGAVASAGGEVQLLSDPRLQFVVREPYFLDSNVPQIASGWISGSQSLSIISRMPQGQIYVDGPHWRMPFGLGSELVVTARGRPLKLFVTHEMEARRQNIGHLRRSNYVKRRRFGTSV